MNYKEKSEVLTTGNNVSSIIAIISKDKLGTLLVGFMGVTESLNPGLCSASIDIDNHLTSIWI